MYRWLLGLGPIFLPLVARCLLFIDDMNMPAKDWEPERASLRAWWCALDIYCNPYISVFCFPSARLPAQKGEADAHWDLETYTSFWMKPVEGEVRRPAPDRIASSMDGRRLSFLLLWMHPVVKWQVSLSRTQDAAGWYAGDLRFHFVDNPKGLRPS